MKRIVLVALFLLVVAGAVVGAAVILPRRGVQAALEKKIAAASFLRGDLRRKISERQEEQQKCTQELNRVIDRFDGLSLQLQRAEKLDESNIIELSVEEIEDDLHTEVEEMKAEISLRAEILARLRKSLSALEQEAALHEGADGEERKVRLTERRKEVQDAEKTLRMARRDLDAAQDVLG
jgi:hypothetical protein